MKVLLFSDLNETIEPMSAMFQGSRAKLSAMHKRLIQQHKEEKERERTPWRVILRCLTRGEANSQFSMSEAAIERIEQLSAAVESSPFDLTVVRKMTALLEQLDREDWLGIYIDMRHMQAQNAFHELFVRKVTERVRVSSLIRRALPDSYEQVQFAVEHGGDWQWADYTGEDFLDKMSYQLSCQNYRWPLL